MKNGSGDIRVGVYQLESQAITASAPDKTSPDNSSHIEPGLDRTRCLIKCPSILVRMRIYPGRQGDAQKPTFYAQRHAQEPESAGTLGKD